MPVNSIRDLTMEESNHNRQFETFPLDEGPLARQRFTEEFGIAIPYFDREHLGVRDDESTLFNTSELEGFTQELDSADFYNLTDDEEQNTFHDEDHNLYFRFYGDDYCVDVDIGDYGEKYCNLSIHYHKEIPD